MSEKPEETLRQINDEAQSSYQRYKDESELHANNIAGWEKDIEVHAAAANREEEQYQDVAGSSAGPEIQENAIKERDFAVERLGKNAFKLEEAREYADESIQRVLAANREHYLDHQAEYHELAVIEAHLDGVEINV
jgi:hypothetical protein